MIGEDKFGFRPIWDAALEIYKEIAKICERHGLRYYATDGTALGAVRHKGFIPWDDDFDMSMPRPDYEKFKVYAVKELPPHLKWMDRHNTSEFPLLFGKVHDCRKDYVLELESKVGQLLTNGVCVDIFPIDGYPESRLAKLWILLSTGIPKCIVRFRAMSYATQWTTKGKFVWLFGALCAAVFPWLSLKKCLDFFDGQAQKYEYEKCEFTGRTCSLLTVLRRAPLKRTIWGKPTPYEFHDTTVMLPEDANAHLCNEYVKWHYMTLPPESARHPTHSYSWHYPWWLGPTR